MFSPSTFKKLYRTFAPLAQPVTLMVNNGTGFTSYSDVLAHVSRYREQELVQGGSINVGDLRLIIETDQLPNGIAALDQKDRINIDNRDYAVIHWDDATRSIGVTVIAVEVTVRG